MTSERGGLRGLYAVTPGIADTAVLCDRVREALAGGAAMIQYRANTCPTGSSGRARPTMTSERAGLRGLYAVTPGIADTAVLCDRVHEALAGGAAMIQYRAKDAPRELALEQARALAAVCADAGVPFIVNDSLDLALEAGADGVHLGRDDVDPREARRRMPRGLIGVSCYADPERARFAGQAGADYVAIGSVFASSTKPNAVRAPLELIARAREISRLPVVAIGGITPGNAPQAIAAGADMVAVINAVFDAPDVRAAAGAFACLFESPASGRHDVRAQPQPL